MPFRTSRGSRQGLPQPSMDWDERLQYFPLLVREIHALLLLLKEYTTEPLYPHFFIYETASSHNFIVHIQTAISRRPLGIGSIV